jgi:Flp pilus assembly protein TadD
MNQKAYSAALQHLNGAIKLSPRNANYFYLAGFCNEKLRNFPQAQSNYINAVRLNSDLQSAVQGQERTTRILNRAIGLNY